MRKREPDARTEGVIFPLKAGGGALECNVRSRFQPTSYVNHKVTMAKSKGKRKAPARAKAGPGKKARAHAPKTKPGGKRAAACAAKAVPETKPVKPEKPAVVYETAETMAKRQREISVSEFFAKNRHLLGFDNPRKALLTAIKEGVDNSLDACEEAGILPEVSVVVTQQKEDRFRVSVTDNGPGIVKAQIPSIFGKLLYGSKFHHLRMARGQQGIGISAAGMYGLLTTGEPIRITSRTGARAKCHYYEIQIDTTRNRPEIIKEEEVTGEFEHGTRVEIDLEARYAKGRQSVDEYLQQTAIANPHVTLKYAAPDGEQVEYKRATSVLPQATKAIKPHPYGVELGILIKMLKETDRRWLKGFLTEDFSRVSPRIASQICQTAGLNEKSHPRHIARQDASKLYDAIQKTKIMNPSTNVLSPIGTELMIAGLKNVVQADFYTAFTRPPAVYRGNPFQIEVGLAYGGAESMEEPVRLLRYANRVPLLYQQSACAVTRSVVGLNWKSYGLAQPKGSLPVGPAVVMVHIASVWVPFTSESKEAVAHYPEIIREIKLGLQECGRHLGRHVTHRRRVDMEMKKRSYIEQYIPYVAEALTEILSLKEGQTRTAASRLKTMLERTRKI